jgi:hypothetical protein
MVVAHNAEGILVPSAGANSKQNCRHGHCGGQSWDFETASLFQPKF